MKAELIVSDMTCQHCVNTITQAVHSRSPKAKVTADLDRHTVTVDPVDDLDALVDAIREEGYDVEPA